MVGESVKECNWCKSPIKDGAKICRECGHWQSLWCHWVRSLPNIFLSLLSVGLAFYIFHSEFNKRDVRSDIETQLTHLEKFNSNCPETSDIDRKINCELTSILEELSIYSSVRIMIKDNLYGEERAYYNKKLEKLNPLIRIAEENDRLTEEIMRKLSNEKLESEK